MLQIPVCNPQAVPLFLDHSCVGTLPWYSSYIEALKKKGVERYDSTCLLLLLVNLPIRVDVRLSHAPRAFLH